MNINKNLMSRNHTAKKRSKKDILYIVIHYIGALGDAKANTDYYKSSNVGASADFFVGHSGDIWQANDYYNYYSWHCGGGLQGSGGAAFYKKCTNANSIGIEMCVKKRSTKTMNATDKDWYFTDETVNATVKLVKYLMKELDIDINHVIRHFDVNSKACPNPFVYDTGKVTWKKFKEMCSGSSISSSIIYRVGTAWKNGKCVDQVGAYDVLANARSVANEASINVPYKVFDPSGKEVYMATVASLETLTAKQLSGLSEAEKIKAVAPLYQQCQKDTGMLASVGLAQFCLESGYATTDLAMYNNLHGMKKSLSGNTWANSTWDGKSIYGKYSPEQDKAGNTTMVYSEFRAYPCMKDSIYDRAAYFIGAMNGKQLRYPGIAKLTNHVEQIKLIRASGYATDVNYVDKLCKIVDKWNLTQYDLQVEKKDEPVIKNKEYVVQAGSFSLKLNAKNLKKKIKKKGIDAIVVKTGKQYVVQCGRFSIKANADNIVKQLKKYNFSAIIKEV